MHRQQQLTEQHLLFYQFNQIPRYATRPDLKDCEYTLGYLCEWLVREHKVSFSRDEFHRKCREYCDAQLLDIDLDVLLSFLVSENILVGRGQLLSFKFMYWLDYFAAHRMHHDSAFAEFILGERRYSAYPEIVEFYAGIDRRRSDAVVKLTSDLASMNSEFVARTGIPAEFNPYLHARWEPTAEDLHKLVAEVDEGVAESSLPMAVKDAMADRHYDRSQPYNQDLAAFIERSSLRQLIQAMRGAARTLRNSDHVPPEEKLKLIEEVMKCWAHVCQVLVILSPMLATQRRATFEDACFVLTDDFPAASEQEVWKAIMSAVIDNVVWWYEDDISSRKMGALMARYAQSQRGGLEELFTVMVMTKHKIPGWESEVKRLIVECAPNSFYLGKLFATLRSEYKEGFCTERSRQALRRLAATALVKHQLKAKDPNQKMIEKGMQAFDDVQRSQTSGASGGAPGG